MSPLRLIVTCLLSFNSFKYFIGCESEINVDIFMTIRIPCDACNSPVQCEVDYKCEFGCCVPRNSGQGNTFSNEIKQTSIDQ